MAARRVYLVLNLSWQYDHGTFYRGIGGLSGEDDDVYRAYLDRTEAELYRKENELSSRQVYHELGQGPFDYSFQGYTPPEDHSTLNRQDFLKRLREIGLEPPELNEHGLADWREWWQEIDATQEQRLQVWQLVDQVQFAEVVEMELELGEGVADRTNTNAKNKSSKPWLYIVRWRSEHYFEGENLECEAWLTGERYVKSFTDQDRAKEYLQELRHGQTAPPRGANPFVCFGKQTMYPDDDFQGLTALTSFDEPIFDDWIRDLGLQPPVEKMATPPYSQQPFPMRDWHAWWEEHSPYMTDYQRSKIWQALDKLEFFEIVETVLFE